MDGREDAEGVQKIVGRGKIRWRLGERVGNEGQQSGKSRGKGRRRRRRRRWRDGKVEGEGMRGGEGRNYGGGGREALVQQLMLSYSCIN